MWHGVVQWFGRLPGSFLLLDPPEHGRMRALVSKAFTTRAVEALRPRVTELVDGLIDEALEAGEVDIVAALAYPVPLTMICDLLGVPLRNPAQIPELLADPAAAVEELLRYDTPVPFPTRTALEDVEFAGRRLPRGTGAILLLGSANRDPDAFKDPERLDLTRFRDPANRQLAFSHGPHFCLGAPMARVESAVTFERLCARTEFTVLADEPPYRPSVSMRGLAALPVAVRRKT